MAAAGAPIYISHQLNTMECYEYGSNSYNRTTNSQNTWSVRHNIPVEDMYYFLYTHVTYVTEYVAI